MGFTYWYLAAWVAGGVALATMLLLQRGRAPLALPLALLGFGAAGFAARALGYQTWEITLASAAMACLVCAVAGYGLMRLAR